MKTFLATIPNRHKAIYLGWFFLHLILYISSGNFLIFGHRVSEAMDYIYPSSWRGFRFNVESYDYSDFILYLVAPILLYYIITLWKKKN